MKTTKWTGIILLFAMIFSFNLSAQTVMTGKESKASQRHENVLKRDLRKGVVKKACAEAKKLKELGYVVPAGKLPLDKQLEKAGIKQAEKDAKGAPVYYISSQTAIAGSYSAAAIHANNSAKQDIAEQIQAKVIQMVDVQVANGELSKDEAEAVNNVISGSKNIISGTLERTMPLVESYRKFPNGKVEAMITIGTDVKKANRVAMDAIKNNLAQESGELAAKVEKMVE